MWISAKFNDVANSLLKRFKDRSKRLHYSSSAPLGTLAEIAVGVGYQAFDTSTDRRKNAVSDLLARCKPENYLDVVTIISTAILQGVDSDLGKAARCGTVEYFRKNGDDDLIRKAGLDVAVKLSQRHPDLAAPFIDDAVKVAFGNAGASRSVQREALRWALPNLLRANPEHTRDLVCRPAPSAIPVIGQSQRPQASDNAVTVGMMSNHANGATQDHARFIGTLTQIIQEARLVPIIRDSMKRETETKHLDASTSPDCSMSDFIDQVNNLQPALPNSGSNPSPGFPQRRHPS